MESFKGKNIYVGLDVHNKNWMVTVMSEHLNLKTIHMSPGVPDKLASYLHTRYPDATIQCAYEAGYSGFWIQERLTMLKVPTIVVNAADIPTTDKEKRFKEDRRDSRKIASALRGGQLEGIYIPRLWQRQDRSIVRQRYRIKADERRTMQRIRAHLAQQGPIPDDSEIGKYWSRRMIKSLEERATREQDKTLATWINVLLVQRKLLVDAMRQVRVLAREERYACKVRKLIQLRGVGLLTAMVYLTEIGDDASRFSIERLHSYCSLIPGSRSSGVNDKKTSLTKRGNKFLQNALIQSSWIAIRNDPDLTAIYEGYRKRMPGSKAIIRVAKKLATRMHYLLINH